MNTQDGDVVNFEEVVLAVRFKHQQIYILKVLDSLVDSLYQNDVLSNVMYQLPISLQEIVRIYINKNINSVDFQKDFIESIRVLLKSCPVAVLRLAIPLSANDLMEISTRLRKVFVSNLLLDIEIDSDLIGGLIFEYEGRVYDYSMISLLDK